MNIGSIMRFTRLGTRLRPFSPLIVARRNFKNIKVTEEILDTGKESESNANQEEYRPIAERILSNTTFMTVVLSLFFFLYIMKLKGQLAEHLREIELRSIEQEEVQIELKLTQKENQWLRQKLEVYEDLKKE